MCRRSSLDSRVPAILESPPCVIPDWKNLADVLVNYSVGVKTGQLVRISGPPVAQPLIVELYRKVLAAGGHPLVRMAPEELQRDLSQERRTTSSFDFSIRSTLFEYEKIDCSIGIWAEENTKPLTNCDPQTDRHHRRPRASR